MLSCRATAISDQWPKPLGASEPQVVNDKGRYLQESDTAHLRGLSYDHETAEVALLPHTFPVAGRSLYRLPKILNRPAHVLNIAAKCRN
jgi:hypothetical protein